MNTSIQTLLAVGLACLLLVAGAPAVSGQTPTDTTYTVALEADGDATVTLTYAFALETAADEAAFDELQTDEATREALAEQFRTEMDAVAERTAARTNRSMAVENATVRFERTDTVGEAHSGPILHASTMVVSRSQSRFRRSLHRTANFG